MYTVQQIGWVYASNGRRWGITGIIAGLSYRDVCEQIRWAGRRNTDLNILDANGKRVSVEQFIID